MIRRDVVRGGAAGLLALAGRRAGAVLTGALAAIGRDVAAQTGSPPNIGAALNSLLLIEHLQADLYATALTRPVASALSAAERAAVEQLSKHEAAHVNPLRAAITAAGATPAAKPTFDFTAGNGSTVGPFADVFTRPATLLVVAQAFEDTAVRAYTGQVGALVSNVAVLQTVMRIQAVEGRHAAKVRRLRGEKGWISGNDRGTLPPLAQPVYGGEENTTHRSVDVATLGAAVGGVTAVTEAFDEPLTAAEVLTIVDLFVV